MSTGLTSYSIESDAVIFLKFRDGRKLRVEIEDLPSVVSVDDLKAIHEALRLRSNYIEKNLPTWAKVVAIVALSLLLGVQATRAAHVIQQRLWPQPKPVPSSAPATSVKPTNVAPSPVAPAQALTTETTANDQSSSEPAGQGVSAQAKATAPASKTVSQAAAPVTQPIQKVVQPIAQTVPPSIKPLTQQVAPLLAPIKSLTGL